MQIKSDKIRKKYDYIIVGAGIIGITILRELLKIGKKKILIVESGTMLSNEPYPSYKKVYSKKFKIKSNSQFSGVGGGSNVWGSLSGIFEKKLIDKYYNSKNFPLSYSEYLSYLKKTKEYGFPDISEFKCDLDNDEKIKEKKFVQITPNIRFSKFSSVLENKNVDFIQNCYVKKIISTDANENKLLLKIGNNIFETYGIKIILCANTIENFKLLKKSSININHKILGNGFMNHPKGVIGTLKYNSKFNRYISKSSNNRVTYLGIQLKNSNHNHYLNISRGFKIPIIHYISQRLIGGLKLFNGIAPFSINLIGKNFLILVIYYSIRIFEKLINKINKDHVYLELYNEIKFNSNNKISYNEESDKVTVDYEIGDSELNAAEDLINMFENKFNCTIKFKPKSRKFLKRITSLDASHHMGGIKCGNFKNDSVVNLNLSLHEEKDIFICGGAIFPFSGVANPTMSYVALSIWLVENKLK